MIAQIMHRRIKCHKCGDTEDVKIGQVEVDEVPFPGAEIDLAGRKAVVESALLTQYPEPREPSLKIWLIE